MFINAKTSLLVVVFLIFTTFSKAQTPSTCFEIESILVDACGNNEGENEMVRFVVGSTNLNVNNLNVNWPNATNLYLGICKNATTANIVSNINSTITGCGFLKEPTGNILPAGSRVILFTSTSFNVALNSFSGLTDTLYAIFQCAGNTAGHFANFGSGTRTLTMSFSSPSGCSDAITYDRSQLVDLTGIPSSADGSTVNFTWSGSATYTNYGCTAPIEIKTVDINETGFTICPGDTINLSANIVGNFSSTSWTGGNGSFSSINSSTTTYYSTLSDNVDFYIYIEGQTTCGAPVKDSVFVQIGGGAAPVNISSSTTQICSGDSILLNATGSGNYLWSNTSTTNSIYVYSAGTYYVSSISSCGNSSDTITLTTSAPINLSLTTSDSILCSGNSATLAASGAPNYTWFNNNIGTTETVNTTGDYYVIGYNDCYRDSQSVSITVINTPSISISSSNSNSEICAGETITLTAIGSGNYLWSTTDTSSTIIVTSFGTFSVTSTNSCGISSDTITITDAPTINLSLTTPNTNICSGNSAVLTANGATNYTWFNNATTSTQTVNTSGTYYVIGYNNCYSDSLSIDISVTNPPSITLNSSSSTNIICSGDNIVLTANGSDNYLWNTSETSPTITVNSAGTFTVSSTNFCGTDSKTIVLSSGSIPDASITGDTIICNNSVQLSGHGVGTFLWSNGSTTSSQSIYSSGTISLIVTNGCGSDTAYITVIDSSVTAFFTTDYVYGVDVPTTINFSTSSSVSSVDYFWNFGNGQTSVQENPSTIFSENGEYTVTLVATNGSCQNTYQQLLLFEKPNSVFIPNIFTPNNDDVNEVFEIIGENIASLDCEIFNRWGEKIYSWDTVTGFWDGSYNGKTVSDGTYFYIAKITWENKTEEIIRGHISLLK